MSIYLEPLAFARRPQVWCELIAGCGAEPVDAAALRAFTDGLAPAGLHPEAVLPCYGLAEATLAVTLSPPGRGLRSATFGSPAREVVSCGPVAPEHELDVVVPARVLPRTSSGKLRRSEARTRYLAGPAP